MRLMITGANGFLGSKLSDMALRKHDVIGTTYSRAVNGMTSLDVSDIKKLEEFFSIYPKPDVIIHCAALVNVDRCETEKEEARRINVNGTKNIVRICKDRGIRLVYLSTDYVFRGDQDGPYMIDSATDPVNFYGETKLEGEKLVRRLKDHLIIRPTILYGYNDESDKKTFVHKVIEALSRGDEIKADDNVKKYPVLIDDVARGVLDLVDAGKSGTYHFGTEKAYTRYEWGLKIAKIFGLDKNLIKPENTRTLAAKPKNVLLDISKTKDEGIIMQDLERGLTIMNRQMGCAFRLIYSVRSDMLVQEQNASSFRIDVGRRLAKEAPAKADIVCPVPESGIFGATGFSAESKIPLFFGIIRDYYTKKTLYESNKGLRSEIIRRKLIVNKEIVKGKDIILVDEAILSGRTLKVVIEKVKEAGAKKIHVRIPAPPMRFNCKYLVLSAKASLLADNFREEKDYARYKNDFEEVLQEHFGVDSVRFLCKDSFEEALGEKDRYCMECFR